MNSQQLAEVEQVKEKLALNHNQIVHEYDDIKVEITYDPKTQVVDISLYNGYDYIATAYFLSVEAVRRFILNGFTDEEVQIMKDILKIKRHKTRRAYFRRLFEDPPLSHKEVKKAALLSNAKKVTWESVKDVIPRLFQTGYTKIAKLGNNGYDIVRLKYNDVELFIVALFNDSRVIGCYDTLVVSKDVLGIIDCSKCLTVHRLGKLLDGDIKSLKKSILHEKVHLTNLMDRIKNWEEWGEIQIYDAELYERMKTILNFLLLESK
jgi:hypothetical protein